ncbi:MAG: hypothetical protein PHV06_01650 [bacterium]|nr:hypothetical protein [bacterium]
MPGTYSRIGGKIDKNALLHTIEDEGIIYDSGSCWVTFSTEYLSGSDFVFKNRKRLSRGRLILTEKRIIALVSGYKVIDIHRSSADFEKLSFDKRQQKRYEIKMDYSKFPAEIKGEFILSYHIKSSGIEIEDPERLTKTL